jgi:hypothetical protein
MKNVEKIAIESVIKDFMEKYQEMISTVISSRQAVEVAKQNYAKVANPLVNAAKESMGVISSEISEEGAAYLEEKLSDVIKIPFKLK